MFFRKYYNYLILFYWFQTIARNCRQKILTFSFWFHNTIIFHHLENLALISKDQKWVIIFYHRNVYTKIMLLTFGDSFWLITNLARESRFIARWEPSFRVCNFTENLFFIIKSYLFKRRRSPIHFFRRL